MVMSPTIEVLCCFLALVRGGGFKGQITTVAAAAAAVAAAAAAAAVAAVVAAKRNEPAAVDRLAAVKVSGCDAGRTVSMAQSSHILKLGVAASCPFHVHHNNHSL
jgi:hypothetical protein